MDKIIGSIGGLLVFILVMLLLFCFFLDSNIIKKKQISVDFKKYLIAVVVLYLFQLAICGLIRSFINNYSPINISNSFIWENTIVFDKLFHFDYNLGFFTSSGNFPTYYYLIRLFGLILFQAYEDISFYIGFLCGLLSYIIIYHLVNRYIKIDNKKDLLILLLLVPGNIFLCIPTPFSIAILLLLLFIYCLINKKNKILLMILAILCIMMHLIGISTIIIWLLYVRKNKVDKKNILSAIYAVIMILVVMGLIFKWNNWYEYIAISCMGILLFNSEKISHNSMEYFKSSFILLNSFLLMGLLFIF